MLIIPSKIALSESEKYRVRNIENLPYSWEQVEQCYFVGDEEQTHKEAIKYRFAGLIGRDAHDTYQNIKLFIHICLKRSEKNSTND